MSSMKLLVHASHLIPSVLKLALELLKIGDVDDNRVRVGRGRHGELFGGRGNRDRAIGRAVELLMGRRTLAETLQKGIDDGRVLVVGVGINLELLDWSAWLDHYSWLLENAKQGKLDVRRGDESRGSDKPCMFRCPCWPSWLTLGPGCCWWTGQADVMQSSGASHPAYRMSKLD
jgi:hypothetical protein